MDRTYQTSDVFPRIWCRPLGPAAGARGRPHRHGRVSQGDQQHILQKTPREEAATQHALQHGSLDRRARHVWIEPDVTEEDSIGGGHGLTANAHGPGATKAVGELTQTLLDVGRRAVRQRRAARDLDFMEAARLRDTMFSLQKKLTELKN